MAMTEQASDKRQPQQVHAYGRLMNLRSVGCAHDDIRVLTAALS